MDFSNFLLMRHELLLLAIILLLIVGEIFTNKNKKESLVHLAIFLFGIHTIIGFFGLDEGELFGGMFRTNNLIYFFKNVLNVGVFILLLQSADWIQEKVIEENKGTEFFMLLLSSLLGMYFMISAGDFLMFYLGLELSTLPVAALAAYETSKRISSEAGIK
ncbi:MAG: NADH-quinone oxidoreductase subunit N, partial [Flavobacteriaceae bacterium]|nr:NADH-quinone oxidoreductase subunit N [Flavobacteriaceae bacterium]